MAAGKSADRDAKRHRREAARGERLKERQQLEARRRPRERLIYAAIALAGVAVIGLLGWSAFRPKLGVGYPSQGGTHISLGESHPAYNSNPPTSGWHYDAPTVPGAYRNDIPDETLIHNLEHGCIWISYRDPKDTDLVTKLEALAARYPTTVVLTPRPKDDSPIAVAAWQRLLKPQPYDEGQIVEFIQLFRNQAPERLNCVGGMTPR